MENLDVLSADELATVVAGVDVHRGLRERLGMCGCLVCQSATPA